MAISQAEKVNKEDNINHPKHYEGSCSIECIDMMEMVFGREALSWYCLINAFKYMWRWKSKNGVEDLDKASWYFDKYNHIDYTPPVDMQIAYGRLSTIMEKFREEIKNDKG